MANYVHIIFYSLVGGFLSLSGAIVFFIIFRKKKFVDKLVSYATPFAAGALLAAVFLDLLKEGLGQSSVDSVLSSALIGIVVFFFAEKFLRWFHHHHQHGGDKPTIPLLIAGDTIHNAMDGVAIAAAFLINVPTGIVTTLAVAAHEIPHEFGEFGLMLSRGMSRGKVILANIISSLATTVFAVVTFALGSSDRLPIGPLLGLSAGFLLYIAMSDIIPEIHERSTKKKLLDIQPALLLLGVGFVAVSIELLHRFVGS